MHSKIDEVKLRSQDDQQVIRVYSMPTITTKLSKRTISQQTEGVVIDQKNIDILVGMDYSWDFMKDLRINSSREGLYEIGTNMGTFITGEVKA